MSHSELTRHVSFESPPAGGPVTGTRVDPPHVMAGDEARPGDADPGAQLPPLAADEEPIAALPPEAALAQIRAQASQLAAYLQRQATSVDHREAELNARLATVENQVRGARLWLAEQQSTVDQRTAELDRRERELDEREARLGGQQASRPTRADDDTAPADMAEIDRREAELSRRQAELDAMAARLSEQLAAAAEVEETRRSLRAAQLRTKDLERAETLLADAHADLDRQRKLLDDQRAEFTEQMEADRQRAAGQNERIAAEHENRARELKRTSDELVARQGVLEEMRADVSRSQQEVLEIRLATEELWARLCGTMAPAALTRSLGQIRVQLAEQHSLVRGELAQQKSEIVTLGAQLADEHRKLAKRREDLQAWADGQQRELQAQAAQLVQQERRLADERSELARRREQWDNERFALNQEIRRLLRDQGRTATSD